MGNKKSKIIKSDATVIEKYDESSSKEHMAILDTDLQTSVSIFIVALGTIISVPSALPGAAVIVFGTVLPMFWSEPNSDVWDNVSSKVSDLISEAIKDVVFQTAVAHLRGLNNLGVDFSKDYETWLNNGNGLDSLSRSYDHLEKTYRDRMPSFAIKGQEHVLLPLYAQAAFSHIKLMRTGYDNYEKWNLNSKTNYISKPDILSKIIELSGEYTNHVIKTYRSGLSSVLNNTSSTWIDYNNYRVINTVAALDWIAYLPVFRPDLYPGNVDYRSYNRVLTQVLKTIDPFDQGAIKIMEFEKNFNKPSSPLLLEELIVTGDFVIKDDYTDPLWEKKRQVISNGLCEVELTVKSTDGYNIFSQMKSGRPPSSSKISYSIPLADTHIKIIDGLHYVKNSIFEPDGKKSHIMGAIAEMKIHESNGSSSIKNLRHRSDFEVDMNVFVVGILNDESLDNMNKLGDIILLDKDKTWNHNYLFKWYHSCVNKSMLQNSDVIPSNDKHLCLQFHAIRAYFSIDSDNLEIVPGPGFTGGDLVKVTPGKKVLFKLDRDGYNKWFKGFYNVRVWFLRDIGDADLSVNIRSNNSFPTSNVRGKVSLGGRHTNPLDAMQDDIMYHQYDSSVLLFNEMPFVVIEVENLSLDKSITIDRVELTFVSEASKFKQ